MSAPRTIGLVAPETLFERVTNGVALSSGDTYVSVRWKAAASESVRDRILAILVGRGWLLVSSSPGSHLMYAPDANVDVQGALELQLSVEDGSIVSLGDHCQLEPRAAAPQASRADRLQRSILSNLSHILGNQGLGLCVDFASWPRVARSVLNFGVELPIGASASSDALERFEGAVGTAIRQFEPRLDGRTLSVDIIDPESALARGELQMRIAADLNRAYGGAGMKFRTVIDLQTGKTTTQEESAHAGRNAQGI